MELSMDEPFSNELCADKPAVRGQNENLLKIMGDSSFYDLTLIAGDQKIGVHKCVVALHSEAMREKLKNPIVKSVDLGGSNWETLAAFARFIYSTKLDSCNNDVDVFSLNFSTGAPPGHLQTEEWQTAIKLKMQDLQAQCEDHLAENLDARNVVKVLTSSIQDGSEKLIRSSLDYISMNLNAVQETEDWREMKAKLERKP